MSETKAAPTTPVSIKARSDTEKPAEVAVKERAVPDSELLRKKESQIGQPSDYEGDYDYDDFCAPDDAVSDLFGTSE
jgi:hypothetical protein